MAREPKRLLEDPEIEAALREDLQRTATAAAPAVNIGAGLAQLEAAIGAESGGSGGEPGSGSAGGSMGGGAGGLVGGIVSTALAVLVGGVVAWLWWSSGPQPSIPSPPPPIETASLDAGASPSGSSRETEIATRANEGNEETSVPELAELATETESPSVRTTRRARRPAPRRPREPSSGNEDRLREEMLLLERARRQLGTDPARAVALAQEGERRFPRGLFSEEREAIVVLGELGLERPNARARAERFLRAHPRGPLSNRIRRTLDR